MFHNYLYNDPQHLYLHLNFNKWHNNVPFYFKYILIFFMIIVIINIIVLSIIIVITISVIITIIIFGFSIYSFIYSFICLLIIDSFIHYYFFPYTVMLVG